MKRIAAVLSCLLLLAALVACAMYYQNQAEGEQIENAGMAENAPVEIKALAYQGEEYLLKKHLRTVLLIGTDNEGNESPEPEEITAFYNYNQADFILLLAVDLDQERIEMLQINRDTMTDVPWLDVIGNYGGTNFEQLCLSFNSGSGGVDSCQNTVDAVSGLLFDAPIEGYIQIPMTAIPVINDLVGGVSVFVEEDMTAVDSAFVQGTTVRLKGEQAERFVRARMGLENDTNLARMNRQRHYMEGFQRAARTTSNSDSDFIMKVVEKLGEHVQTNLSGNQLIDLLEKLGTYEVAPIRVPEGDLRIGEYYEFYVDEASLWENVREVYCQ